VRDNDEKDRQEQSKRHKLETELQHELNLRKLELYSPHAERLYHVSLMKTASELSAKLQTLLEGRNELAKLASNFSATEKAFHASLTQSASELSGKLQKLLSETSERKSTNDKQANGDVQASAPYAASSSFFSSCVSATVSPTTVSPTAGDHVAPPGGLLGSDASFPPKKVKKI